LRRRILIAVVAVALAAVAIGAFLLWPRGTTEVTTQQALEDFRERSGSTDLATSDAATPDPGVYTYAADGREEVKLGPLPSESRPLPDTVTAVVVDSGDACFDWTLNLFAEHTEQTRYCTDPTLRLDAHTKHQKIGALSPTATMSCDPNALVAPDEDTTTLQCSLDLSGGPASISAKLTGTATAGSAETLTIGGVDTLTTPITVHYDVSGDLSGTWTETVWWSADHLPVRVDRQLDLSGPATFTETSHLELQSLEPAS
jgi:hypothetical protein